MNHRLVSYLEDAGLVLATYLVLTTVALAAGFAWALWLIFAGCIIGLMALRLSHD